MSIYDNANIKGYNPNAGQQQPDKYPYVGDAYRRYGEQPGYVYSPRDDRYYRDPAAQDAVKRYEEEQGLREKEPKQPGLLNTVAPVAGTLGAMYLAKSVGENIVPYIKDAFSSTASSAAPSAAQSTGQGLLSASDSGASALANTGTSAASSGGAYGVQTLADGSTLMSDGSVLPAGAESTIGSTLGTVAGIAGAAKGSYDVARGWGKGGEGVRSGLTTLGASLGGMGAGPLGAVAGAAIGNTVGYGFQGSGIKNDAALAAMGPPGWTLLAAKKLGLKPHISTRQRARSNTQGLLSVAQDDPTYQNYVQGMRQQYESAPVDPSKPFAGKYASWEDYVKGGLEASDLTGVYGNIKQYGPEWAKLTQEQRQAITQENINRGNYYSEGGDVLLKDQKAAQEAYDAVMGKTPAATPQVRGAAPLPPRSETLSPGIGKDGKPINRGLLTVR